ncbi:aminoacyl-tRNA hydrolase [Prescottella equi]|uniref:aminoacyl-tRNA hydrolase n=1 Tax=Rhodococcus hoagii TaxID=43767 RepID=UPI000A1159E5|nr:aminoacyl-tRNA hydrolase [Prescottella equi]ORL80383.1 peptidyl-tRNA hydrolase [Prescottella equi]
MTLTGDGFAARHGVLAAGYGSRPDPEDPAQVLAMPMVLHLPKVDPPARSDLLAAAASATVALCLDERVGPDDDGEPGPWQGAFREWADARIRKVARRARGAQARALVPGPVGALDPRIRKLQIGGTDLEHDEPGPVPDGVPTLWVNASLGMSVGKAAAQVGHASMILAGAMPVERVRRWAADGYRCAVRDADPGQWAQLCDEVARGAAVAVRDAGFTEVAPGSMTVIAPIP